MVRSDLFQNKAFIKTFTLVLLVSSSILALFDVEACLKIAAFLSDLFFRDAQTGMALEMPLTLVLSFSALSFIVYTFEFHLRHLGSQASRKLFVYTFFTQIALFIAGCLLMLREV